MTGRGGPPGRGSGGSSKGGPLDDDLELSAEEVERRVEVRGGGAPRAPMERPIRDRRAPRRGQKTVARDSLLLLGLVIVGLVAVRILLPDGPLSASASPTPGSTEAAAASLPPPTVGPPPNRATVIVKMHVINNSGGAADASDWDMILSGEIGSDAIPNSFAGSEAGTSVSIPAGKSYSVADDSSVDGYAGRVPSADCSKLSGVGLPAGTTVTCTITRNDRPRILVKTHVITDDGGTASASDWDLSVDGGEASPTSFIGSESGTLIVVGFDLTYTVTMSGPTGYDQSKSGDCGPTSLGVDDPQTTCTFTLDDQAPAPSQAGTLLKVPLLLAVVGRWRSIPTA